MQTVAITNKSYGLMPEYDSFTICGHTAFIMHNFVLIDGCNTDGVTGSSCRCLYMMDIEACWSGTVSSAFTNGGTITINPHIIHGQTSSLERNIN